SVQVVMDVDCDHFNELDSVNAVPDVTESFFNQLEDKHVYDCRDKGQYIDLGPYKDAASLCNTIQCKLELPVCELKLFAYRKCELQKFLRVNELFTGDIDFRLASVGHPIVIMADTPTGTRPVTPTYLPDTIVFENNLLEKYANLFQEFKNLVQQIPRDICRN
ncbi:hypothetical protein ROZALSC1DRAFT_26309, partial [Rozella allomycis CSF55]